jgi:hypothetical protein
MDEPHCLWFEIPADMQGLMIDYLTQIINAYEGDRLKKKFRTMISKRTLKTDDFTPSIPVRFESETVHFYTRCRVWRVGATNKPLTDERETIKEEILLDINSLLIPA